jgi:hypothetical protein
MTFPIYGTSKNVPNHQPYILYNLYIYISFLWLLLLQLYINIKLWQEIHVISPLCGDLCDWISVGILVIRSFILSSLWRCYSQLATDIVTDDIFTFYVINKKNVDPMNQLLCQMKNKTNKNSRYCIYNHELPVIRGLKWVLWVLPSNQKCPIFRTINSYHLCPMLNNMI